MLYDIFSEDFLFYQLTFYSSDFKHLSKILVNKGQAVTQGREVAVMGNTDWASAETHLHYNCYKDGARVNSLEHTYLYPEQEICDADKDKVMIYYEEQNTKFNIGDKVIINGYLYVNANASEPSGRVRDKETIITRYVEDTQHPYNTDGDLGWMDTDSIRLIDNVIYIVQKGDTLSSIANRYNTTYQRLAEINNIDNPNLIYPGQKIVIG